MAFTLVRADAIYTVPFASPALELLGSISDLIRGLYQMFADRYPDIPVGAFRALSSNNLSEVGLQVSLFDGRLELSMRVDQMSVLATNLRSPQETMFGQDCALLMHAFMEKTTTATQGAVTLRICKLAERRCRERRSCEDPCTSGDPATCAIRPGADRRGADGPLS